MMKDKKERKREKVKRNHLLHHIDFLIAFRFARLRFAPFHPLPTLETLLLK